jgi:ubiquinone/menaquinone biosynthesis C-methylase UbiE
VVCDSSLQNFTNPLNFFKESYRVLNKGGKLRILTANAGFWGTFGNAFYGGYDKDGKRGEHDHNYLLFTPTLLKNFVYKVGFKEFIWRYEYSGLFNKQPKNLNYVMIKILASINSRWYPNIYIEAIKD